MATEIKQKSAKAPLDPRSFTVIEKARKRAAYDVGRKGGTISKGFSMLGHLLDVGSWPKKHPADPMTREEIGRTR